MFLRYIQTKDEATKAQIDSLLAKNPSTEAREFYNQILLDVTTSDEHAGEVFATQSSTKNYFALVQKLLHFQPQISSSVAATEESIQEMVLLDGVYKIESAQRIFISVSQDLLDTLPQGQKTTIETFLQNPKFISANSKAKNGIKHYANDTYKLKTAKTDIGLIATKSFIDDKGNTLIIFDQTYSHKDFDRSTESGNKIELTDISDMIYTSCSNKPRDSHHNDDQDLALTTPLDDMTIMMLGESDSPEALEG